MDTCRSIKSMLEYGNYRRGQEWRVEHVAIERVVKHL